MREHKPRKRKFRSVDCCILTYFNYCHLFGSAGVDKPEVEIVCSAFFTHCNFAWYECLYTYCQYSRTNEKIECDEQKTKRERLLSFFITTFRVEDWKEVLNFSQNRISPEMPETNFFDVNNSFMVFFEKSPPVRINVRIYRVSVEMQPLPAAPKSSWNISKKLWK